MLQVPEEATPQRKKQDKKQGERGLAAWANVLGQDLAEACDAKPAYSNFLTLQCFLPCLVEVQAYRRGGVPCRSVEVLPNPAVKVLVIHSVKPFAASAAASVCVAREQCVLTLPSEQPMAAAVSAMSISSQ